MKKSITPPRIELGSYAPQAYVITTTLWCICI